MGKKTGFFKRVWRIFRGYFLIAGIISTLFFVWLVAGWTFYFDRWLVVSERPVESEAIICIPKGLGGNHLPTQPGWQSIYTAVQLYLDGYAGKIVFTGGGPSKVSEAEVYAEVAQWLGLPTDAIVINPSKGRSTSDHPNSILKLEDPIIKRDTQLLIVTSSLHSRRTSLCFKKKGFINFRIVTGYVSKIEKPKVVRSLKTSELEEFTPNKKIVVRSLKTSEFKEFTPNKKIYNDIFMRLRRRSEYFFRALREVAAILYYKVKGYV